MAGAVEETFRKLRDRVEKAFIPFITAGDPNLGTTVSLVPELARAGCDIVELGVPFSDPVADGPTIQRSSERALRHGCRLADILQAVGEIRKRTDVPIVLFSYYNPLYQYGIETLARDAASAGVDGVLATDLAPEESTVYRESLGARGLDTIFLAAPTSTEERLARIAACARGFVYLVSRTGVTGARERLSDSVGPILGQLRRHTSLPVAVGFGISRPEHVKAVWEIADGAVVGSAIVGLMEQGGDRETMIARVREFCSWLTNR